MTQWVNLSEAAVDDIVVVVIAALVIELRNAGVAGAGRAVDWDLAERVRQAIRDHHRQSRQRCALTPGQPPLERV